MSYDAIKFYLLAVLAVLLTAAIATLVKHLRKEENLLKYFLKMLFKITLFLLIAVGILLYKTSISSFNMNSAESIDSQAQEISSKFPDMSSEAAYTAAKKQHEDGALGLTFMIFVIPFGLLGIYFASIKKRSKLGWGLFSALVPQLAIPFLILFIPKNIKEITNEPKISDI